MNDRSLHHQCIQNSLTSHLERLTCASLFVTAITTLVVAVADDTGRNAEGVVAKILSVVTGTWSDDRQVFVLKQFQKNNSHSSFITVFIFTNNFQINSMTGLLILSYFILKTKELMYSAAK